MNLTIFDTIDSTNEYLKNKKDNKDFDTVLAHEQTKGRGSRGRNWLSTEGVLMFSTVIKEDKNISIEEYTKLPLIVGIGLLKALSSIEDLPFMFKWTNDIYLYDKKLSGILVEKRNNDFIIGIGVNLNIVEFGDLEAISLKKVTNKNYDKIEILQIIFNKVKEYIYKFYRGEWPLILSEINEKNYLLNKNIKFISPQREYQGIVLGINSHGELILEENFNIHHLRIGEVSTK